MLRLFRWNGEQVRMMEGELTVENACEMYWKYMGDVNKRTDPKPRSVVRNGRNVILVGIASDMRVEKF